MTSKVIDIRGADGALYPVFAEWWVAHGWPAVPMEFIPRCGVMVESGGVMKAAGWLFMDNSGCGIGKMEWAVTNPSNKPKESVQAIRELVGAVKVVADALDYGVIFTSVKQPSLIRLFERCGFVKSDTGMTNMIALTRG